MIPPNLTDSWLHVLGPQLSDGYRGAGPCHDLSHVARVSVLAERIAAEEAVDETTAVLCALLHDIGHASAVASGADDHELRSAGMAERLITGRVSPEAVEAIVDAIAGRRFVKLHLPRTRLGAVLDDADNLDALGLTGVARAFLWLGEDIHAPVLHKVTQRGRRELVRRDLEALRSHWTEKLQVLPASMRTTTGRRLAQDRAVRMAGFISAMEDELTELGG